MNIQEVEQHGEKREYPFMNFGIKSQGERQGDCKSKCLHPEVERGGQGEITPIRVPLEECDEFLAIKTDIPDLRLLLYGRVRMLDTLR